MEQVVNISKNSEVTPQQVFESLEGGSPPRLIDVRTAEEWEIANIKDGLLINEELAKEIIGWPKDTAIVFFCHHGQRSLDAVLYFAGLGFTNVKSMTGGIEAWSLQIDPSIPRY